MDIRCLPNIHKEICPITFCVCLWLNYYYYYYYMLRKLLNPSKCLGKFFSSKTQKCYVEVVRLVYTYLLVQFTYVANYGQVFHLIWSSQSEKTIVEREGSPEKFPFFWMGRPNKPTQIPKIFMVFSSYICQEKSLAFGTGTHPFQLMYVVENNLANMLKRNWICNFSIAFQPPFVFRSTRNHPFPPFTCIFSI